MTAAIPVATPFPYSTNTYNIVDVSDITQDITLTFEDVIAEDATLLDNITMGPYTPNHADSGNTANVATHVNDYIELTSERMTTDGFIGSVDIVEFGTLIVDEKLFFVDRSSVESYGSTIADANLGDIGTQVPMVETMDDILYKFTFFQNGTFPLNDLYQINEADADIFLKQLPYSHAEFVSTETLTKEDVIVRLTSLEYVSTAHYTFMTPAETGIPNTYRIIFWRDEVVAGDEVDIYTGTSGTLSEYTYHGRTTATITQQAPTVVKVNSYKTIASIVTDKYITDLGYVDYSKVIVASKDISGDPYAFIDMISSIEVDVDGGITTSVETTHYVVLETYTFEDNEYERVSSYAVAFAQNVFTNTDIPETAKLYHDTLTRDWYRNTSQGWVLTTDYQSISDTEIEYAGTYYTVNEGKSFVIDDFMSYRWDHYADKDKRIDPSTSNIIDVYVLTTDYTRRITEWKDIGYISSMPLPPTTFELNKLMEKINKKAAIADHISYIPAKFKFLFGDFADEQNQAYFKVVKRVGTTYTDSEIKSKVAEKVNEYFDLNKWDFGETFYFSELAAYLHVELGDYIASVTITPKYASYDFRNMLSISCEVNEIFMSLVSSMNVKIIDKLTNSDLIGE